MSTIPVSDFMISHITTTARHLRQLSDVYDHRVAFVTTARHLRQLSDVYDHRVAFVTTARHLRQLSDVYDHRVAFVTTARRLQLYFARVWVTDIIAFLGALILIDIPSKV